MTTMLNLLTPVNASSYVESQYGLNEFCQGPPTAMIGFTALNLTEGKKTEKWPIFSKKLGILSTCGNAPLPVEKSCCISLIPGTPSYAQYQGSKSGIKEPISSMDDFLQGVPPFETASYCKIFPKGLNYKFIHIRNDGYSCTDDHFSCSKTGIFSIYNITDLGCRKEPIQQYKLTDTRQSYSEVSYFGEFTAEYSSIDGGAGSGTAEWITFVPASDLVPNHQNFMEVFSTILFVVAMILALAGLIFWTIQYFKRKTFQMLLMLFSHLSIIFYMISRLYYAYSIFRNSNLYIFNSIKDYAFGISTLVCCISTSHFLSTILEMKAWKTKVMHCCVIILNLGLNGGLYFRVVLAFDKTTYTPYIPFIKLYSGFSTYWLIFYFVWNVVPVFFIVWKLTSMNSTGFKSHLRLIQKYDPLFFYFMGTQFLVSILFYILKSLQMYTNMLGSDRNNLAMEGVVAFSLSFNSVINCVIINRIKVIASSSKMTSNGSSWIVKTKDSTKNSNNQWTSSVKSEKALHSMK